MSYILDALKKSEQERKQGKVPDLDSFRDSSPPRSNQRTLVYLLAGSLLIFIVGINFWALFARTAPPPAPVAATASQKKGLEEAAAAPPAAGRIAQTVETEGDETSIAKTAQNDILGREVAPEQAEETRADQAITQTARAPEVPEAAEPTMRTAAGSAGQNNPSPETAEGFESEPAEPPFEELGEDSGKITVSYSDLPINIRNALPELSIAAHYYSNSPSSRMASINGRIMRQGQKIAEGLTLKEINEEGVVFSYGKYRFSLKVFNP
jgi:general secretion pathway protein B